MAMVLVKQWVLPVASITGILTFRMAWIDSGQMILFASVNVPSISAAMARINALVLPNLEMVYRYLDGIYAFGFLAFDSDEIPGPGWRRL
jgi:hypothetical protein